MLSSTIGCFLLNTAVLILGTTVFFTTTMGTWDHLAINLPMGSIIGVPAGLMLSGLMLIPFLTSNAVLAHRKVTRHRRVWLCGPTFVVVAILLAGSFWISLPAQRLEFVAMDDLANASRIRVTGSSGFLASDWVAVCRIDEVSFLSYCRSQRLVLAEGDQNMITSDSATVFVEPTLMTAHDPRTVAVNWGVPGGSFVGSIKLRSKAHLRVGAS